MPIDAITPCRPIGQALEPALVRIALRMGVDDAHRKRNLAELYEAGAITGATFADALRVCGLEAA